MNYKDKLTQISELLKELDDFEISQEQSSMFIETKFDEVNKQLAINANNSGLVHLARIVVDLANKSIGAHNHFDENSNLDNCEMAFSICHKQVEW